MVWTVVGVAVLLGTGGAVIAGGDDEPGGIDDILGGFDDAAAIQDVGQEEGGEQPVDIGGRLALAMSYNFAHRSPQSGETDWRGLSQLRPLLGLELEARIGERWRIFASGHAFYDLAYGIEGRDGFTPQVLDTYEHELELDDSFVHGRLGEQMHIQVGRQVVAWGTSETIRVTDILNPVDLREPGRTDIEDLRLPVTMTRLDLVGRRWTASAMAIHEIRFNKNPVYGSDFYPYALPLPPAVEPDSSLANTELACSAHGRFSGFDLSLYAADVYDDAPHLEFRSAWRPQLVHSRLTMLGAAAEAVTGSWVLKGEMAHLRGLEFTNLPGERLARSDLLAGMEFFGWDETSLVVEAALRHLHGFEPDLQQAPDLSERDRFEWVVRLSRALLNQTLTLSLVAVTYEIDGSGGALQRLEARYDATDHLEITGGVVLYSSGDAFGFQDIGDNDRLFFDLVYRF